MTTHSSRSGTVDNGEFDFVLLDRYWLGETSPEETARVREWLGASPQRQAQYELLRQELRASHWGEPSSAELSRMTARVIGAESGMRASLSTADTRQVPGASTVARRKFLPPRLRYVAVGVLGVIALVVGWRVTGPNADNEIVQHKSIYTTPKGQRANVTLPDGSHVVLNAGSRLEVPSNFAFGTRTVQLQGEALFTVTHNMGTPFTVVAGPSVTKVLGTRFAVRYFRTDTAAIVAVQNGKVVVDTTVLTAGQEAYVRSKGQSFVQPTTSDRFVFATGRLVISGQLLRDIIPDLNRWYDVEIQLADTSMAEQSLTWEAPEGSISDLISALEVALPVRVLRERKIITLYPKVNHEMRK